MPLKSLLGDFRKRQDLPSTRSFAGPFALTRRQFAQGAIALAASCLAPGVSFAQSAANLQPKPNGLFTQASLTVTDTAAGSISPAFAGLSYEKSNLSNRLFSVSNSNLIGLFNRIRPSVLRVGGNSVDKNVWYPNGPGQIAGQIAPSDVASLAAFVKATGWQCLYGINLGGAAAGATTPALAAAEVACAVQQFGSSLLGIEIGNECDLYGDVGNYFAGNWSLSQFLSLWREFRAAILATTPNVPMTGPASAVYERTWTVPFGQAVN
jgi:hypothetical protein